MPITNYYTARSGALHFVSLIFVSVAVHEIKLDAERRKQEKHAAVVRFILLGVVKHLHDEP